MSIAARVNNINPSFTLQMATKAAEMTKLLENIHRAVNIGLVNEFEYVADEKLRSYIVKEEFKQMAKHSNNSSTKIYHY